MWKFLKNSGLIFLYISVFILYTGAASTLIQDDKFTSVVFFIFLILFIAKKKKFNIVLIYILLVWFIINFFSAFFINPSQQFSFVTLIGVTLRITMPYLIVKLVGPSFFDKVVKYVYVLSIIGLIFFTIQLMFNDLFYSLAGLLNFMTQSEQRNSGGWYIFIYMYSGWAQDRNCGFAWEPGGYACILIFLLGYQLVRNHFKFDKYSIVFIISIISTFSTSGYIALYLLAVSIILYKKRKFRNPFYLIASIGLLAFFVQFYNTSEFMKKKIDRYIEEKDIQYTTATGLERINRIEELDRTIDASMQWPFGNGILNSDFRINKYGHATGPNSISALLLQWGWIGIYFLFITTFGFYYFFSKRVLISILLTSAFFVVLNSNPDSMRYLIFSTFFFYYIFLSSVKKEFTIFKRNYKYEINV